MQLQKTRLRQRHGATAVLVAILIVLVGGMAAFAIDLARVYSGVNEMQTGADAAALAGAIKLQHTGTSPVSAVQTFAANNSAFGSAITLPTADIEGGTWDPAAGTFTPSATWATNNAVKVTTRSTPALAFGRLMGRTTLSASRPAIAWIANQQSINCVKPWGIDVSYVNGLMTNAITTQAGVAELRQRTSTLAGQQLMTIVAGPDGNVTGTTLPTKFQALTDNNSSRRVYQNAIIDNACADAAADYTAGTTTQVQPGNGGGDIPRTTVTAVELNLNGQQGAGGVRTCRAQANLDDATCYDAATGLTAGVTVTVAIVTPTPGNTSSATVNSFVQFRLMCMFRGGGVSNGNGNQPGTSRASETCPWLTAFRSAPNDRNFIQGTIVGFPIASVAINGGGNTLGNTIGGAQKLLLVR